MIPTLDTIEGVSPWVGAGIVTWLRDMRDEIDLLREANKEVVTLRNSLNQSSLDHHKAVAVLAKSGWTLDGTEWKPPVGPNPSPLLEQIDKLRAELDATKAQRDMLHRRLYPTPCEGCPGCSSYADCPDEIHRLTTALDAAHTEAALARDALSKATTAPREGEIAAWENSALSQKAGNGSFVIYCREIDEAVALMRRAATAAPAKPAEPARAEGSFAFLESEPNFYDPKPAPDHVPDAGKMVPAPTDDTRELVAQLADAIVTLCDGQGFGVTLSEVKAIAAQLRGGK